MTKYISSPERMDTEDKEEAEAQSEDNLTEQINTRTERREKRTKKQQADPPVDPEQESVGNAEKKPIILH